MFKVMVILMLSTLGYSEDIVIPKNWGIQNTSALKAWELPKGKNLVKIAVIDTGLDIKHPYLKGFLCPEVNGEYGYNFVSNNRHPTDTHGHGTAVVGILKAMLPGFNNVCIIPIKFFTEKNNGESNTENFIKSVAYAIKRKVNIISFSGGGPSPSIEEADIIRLARSKGILIVTAAGNAASDIDDKESYYPANYLIDNIVSVAAINRLNEKAGHSNWGSKSVHLGAPGYDIYTTAIKNDYHYVDGTSAAVPFVTATAAMMLSINPKLTPRQVRNILLKTVDKVDGLKGKVMSDGKLNTFNALKKAMLK